MYIQVTTRCNMRCIHCLYACGPRGQDMSFETFKLAVDCAREHQEEVTIGGGEPTLHPLILDMVAYACTYGYHRLSSDSVTLITNGTCDEETWKHLVIAREESELGLQVSNSIFHDKTKQKPWVVKYAKAKHIWWSSFKPILDIDLLGRAIRNQKRIYEIARRHRYTYVEFGEGDLRWPRVTPEGLVVHDTRKPTVFGPLSPEVVAKAYEGAIRR